MTLCQVRGEKYTVQCRLCGAQWTTKAKYAQALAMDYSAEDLAKMTAAREAPRNSARAQHKRKVPRTPTTVRHHLGGGAKLGARRVEVAGQGPTRRG